MNSKWSSTKDRVNETNDLSQLLKDMTKKKNGTSMNVTETMTSKGTKDTQKMDGNKGKVKGETKDIYHSEAMNMFKKKMVGGKSNVKKMNAEKKEKEKMKAKQDEKNSLGKKVQKILKEKKAKDKDKEKKTKKKEKTLFGQSSSEN